MFYFAEPVGRKYCHNCKKRSNHHLQALAGYYSWYNHKSIGRRRQAFSLPLRTGIQGRISLTAVEGSFAAIFFSYKNGFKNTP